MTLRRCTRILAGFLFTAVPAWAQAQVVVAHSPVFAAPVQQTSVVAVPTVHSITAYAPVFSYSPVVSAPPIALPAASTYTYRAPVTAYSPVTNTPAVVAYSPITAYAAVTSYSPTVAAIPVGPSVLVKPKVYVEGEPIRNFFRAFTP